jgi:hypothetical protein
MSDAESRETPANQHKVDIGNNPALTWLYIGGIVGIVVGVIVFVAAGNQIQDAYDPSGALAWQGLGGLLTNVGGLFLFGALVVHGINWQIGRSGLRR